MKRSAFIKRLGLLFIAPSAIRAVCLDLDNVLKETQPKGRVHLSKFSECRPTILNKDMDMIIQEGMCGTKWEYIDIDYSQCPKSLGTEYDKLIISPELDPDELLIKCGKELNLPTKK